MMRTVYQKSFDLALYLRAPRLARALKKLDGRSPHALAREEQIDLYVAMQAETSDPANVADVRGYHARVASSHGADLPQVIERSIRLLATDAGLPLELERDRAPAKSAAPKTIAANAAASEDTVDEVIESLKKIVGDPKKSDEERERARKALEALGVDVAPKGRKASGTKAPFETSHETAEREKQAIAALSAIGSGQAKGYSEDERFRAREALRSGYGLNDIAVVPHASVDGTAQSMHPKRSAAEVAEDDWKRRYGVRR